jgi:hypothetical protein
MSKSALTCPKCSFPFPLAAPVRPGEKVHCPRCGAGIALRRHAEAPRPAAAARRGGGGAATALLAVCGLLVLAAAGVGVYWLLFRDAGGRPADRPATDQRAADGPGDKADKTDKADTRKDTPDGSVKKPVKKAPRPLPPLPEEEQKRVDKAVADGVAFLKKQQNATTGVWDGYHIDGVGPGDDNYFKLAYNALPALTLLECGAKPSDDSVKYAIAYVRENCRPSTINYETSLAILLLDKVGTKQDKKLIRTLALRLIQAQQADGGWTYGSPAPLSDKEEESLLSALEMTRPASLKDIGLESSKGDNGEPGAKNDGVVPPETYARAQETAPDAAKNTVALQPPDKQAEGLAADNGSDNSNTQFVVLALWVAGRHGVPTERALAIAAQRFRRLQRDDGHWPYQATRDFVDETFTPPTMTGAGLITLGVGHGLSVRLKPELDGRGQVNDPAIQKGMAFVAARIGAPLGPTADRPKDRDRGAVCLYYFWTLERVGVLYNSQKIGGKDWYQWGAELLVDNQGDDGSWNCGNYWGANPWADTCFALLFLKRANLVQDLTDNLEFVIDSSK